MKTTRSGLVWVSLAAALALCFFMWEVSRGFRTVLASSIATVSSVFGQTGAVNTPVTTTDISTPTNPSAGLTRWYTKGGALCSLSPAGSENCTGAASGNVMNGTANQVGYYAATGNTISPFGPCGAGTTFAGNGSAVAPSCSSNLSIRSVGGSFDGGGSALTSGKTTYVTVPFACTIAGYNILVDTGTASFDVWKIATGTAIPTVANTIISGTSYLAISSGTALHSTSTAALTSTTVSANDIIGVHLQATASATFAQLLLQCNAGS